MGDTPAASQVSGGTCGVDKEVVDNAQMPVHNPTSPR